MKNIFIFIGLLNIAFLSITSDKQAKCEEAQPNGSALKTDSQVIASYQSDLAKIIRDTRKKSESSEQEKYFCERVAKLMIAGDSKVIIEVLEDMVLAGKKEQISFKD